MPEIAHRGLYAASVNPPRRAKRPPIPTSDESSSPEPPSLQTHHRAILPMRPYAPRPATIVPERAATPPPPAKRGRKPGPLSRSAREAQRRLNHSIIEKARRTKINDALATLKQLVPPDYGRQKRNPTDSRDEEDEDEDDEDYEEDNKKGKPKVKGTGKKEEKEKEFKLEILVRTVSFLQDLLVRVESLEANAANPCSNCGARPSQQPKKRKWNALEDESKDDRHNTGPDAKAPRLSDSSATDTRTADTAVTGGVPISVRKQTESPNPVLDTGSARLPSISSWLPNSNSVIDPQLLSGQTAPQRPSPPVGSYLPSPPSSTHFDPVRASTVPPLLNLGPVATAAMVSSSSNTLSSSSSVRTPEDESAASLLLQISASSPTFRPINSSAASTSNYSLKDPSNFLLHSEGRTQRGEGHVRHAQTPSSLLGMKAAERKH